MKSSQFVQIPSGVFEGGVALCEAFGGKTEVEEVEVCSGGAGSNNAVSFARKGLRTALVAEMGKDLTAAAIKAELRREGVDIRMLVEEEGEETGISSILVGPDGGRSVAVYRGASKMLTKSDMNWDRLRANWFVISSLGGEMELLEGLTGHANTYGIKVAFNPGRVELEQLLKDEWRMILDRVEVLILNREEAGLLTGWDFANTEIWQNNRRFCEAKVVVVTNGREGGKVYEKDQIWFYSIEKVKTYEETGAGDAFGSGLVAALIKGKNLEEAVEFGKKQAASVVQFMGAKRGLLRSS